MMHDYVKNNKSYQIEGTKYIVICTWIQFNTMSTIYLPLFIIKNENECLWDIHFTLAIKWILSEG